MGLFKSKGSTPSRVPPLGSGRQLHSDHPVTGCLEILDGLLRTYRQPPYPSMPSLHPATFSWESPASAPPAQVHSCLDADEDIVFVAFWPEASGTTMGLIPLGSGDERLQTMPMIGHWKQRDPSLSSTGTTPAGALRIGPPAIVPNYVDELLTAAGFPATPHNRAEVEAKVCEMFLIKAVQFVQSVDPSAADRFLDAHRWTPGAGNLAQRIVDDLLAFDAAITPYAQDMPARMRAILLEAASSPDSFWGGLERTAPAPAAPPVPAVASPDPAPAQAPVPAPPTPVSGGPSATEPTALTAEVLSHLQARFPSAISYRELGVAIPSFERTTVLIDVSDAGAGAVLVKVRAPVALGLELDDRLLTWAGSKSGAFDFGTVRAHRADPSAPAQVEFEVSLFGNNLTWRALDRAITTVESESRRLIPEVTGQFGGQTLR